ncbi:Acyl-CoA delta-14 desaturase, partial [Operophtera brumata]
MTDRHISMLEMSVSMLVIITYPKVMQWPAVSTCKSVMMAPPQCSLGPSIKDTIHGRESVTNSAYRMGANSVIDSATNELCTNDGKSEKIKRTNSIENKSKIKNIALVNIGTDYTYKHEVVWKNAIGFLILHIFAIWGFYLGLSGRLRLVTIAWVFLVGYGVSEGVTIGAHRLFTHKSFKATPLLKGILIALQTGAGQNIGTDYTYKHKIIWTNAIVFLILHFFALWGSYLVFTGWVTLITIAWTFLVLYGFSEGITIGAHRLYTHKSFKATPLLKAILMLLQCGAGQNSIFIWSRDHRLHHRYSDTDGDPHNAKRGFFFSHIGWLMTKKHPYLYILIAIVLPVWVPVHFFGETLWHSLLVCYFFRYVFQLNGTWLVNSAAHIWGSRPYDQNLQPVESWFVSFISLGEGWHNYHHAFPWDYKAAELTMHFNFSATLIRFFETIGLAYDLKTASPEM